MICYSDKSICKLALLIDLNIYVARHASYKKSSLENTLPMPTDAITRKVHGSLSEKGHRKILSDVCIFEKKRDGRLSIFFHKIVAPITLSLTSKYILLNKNRILQSRNHETIDILLAQLILFSIIKEKFI